MKTDRKLGIWMDHSSANLMELKDTMTIHTIESGFTYNKKVDALHRSESIMHNKKQQLDEAYFKELSDEILKFDHVLLFGPTDAISELNNFLSKDLHFKDIKIDVESADKMTDNEQVAFVKNHFEKQKSISHK
jgi:hypothetical protein